MKRYQILGLSVLCGLMATSCSDDDKYVEETAASETETSYIAVNICDVGADAATRATDGGYTYGTEAERRVANAKFFFYDDMGSLVSESSLWSESDLMTGEAVTTGSVEYFSKAAIPVTNVNPNNKPSKLITVINPPESLEYVSSLSGILKSLTNSNSPITSAGRFTMTTSSYKDDGRTCYYATDLDDKYFFTTPEEAVNATADNRLNIYVERLAVKVQLAVDQTNLVKGNVDDTYKIGEFTYKTIDDSGEIQTQNLTLYANFLSWGLNSTTKKSYLMKHLTDKNEQWDTYVNEAKTEPYFSFTWNDPANHRSYWCDSYNYGLSSASFFYPARYQTSYTEGDPGLNYISGNQITNTIGTGVGYCNENTNTAGMVNGDNLHAIVTSVLVKAALTDEDGVVPFEDNYVIKYNGTLYSKDAYRYFVYNYVMGLDGMSKYTHDGKGLQLSDVEIGQGDYLNGRIALKLTDAAAAYTWTDGNDDTESSAVVDAINQKFQDVQTDNDAIGYTDGLMYYSIPIEHLNTRESVVGAKYVEAEYGVVRNHCYNLTITELSNIGHGIDDPDEPIIPNPTVTEDYYIGATINILAWKTVSQSVVL